MLSGVVSEEVRQSLIDEPPRFFVSDDMTWLNDAITDVDGLVVDAREHLLDRIEEHYSAVRAVHGSRPIDVSTIYAKGLVPLIPEDIHQRAREIFLSGDFPELTGASLDAAIRKVGSDLREGRLYFEGNEPMLIEECGHYMLYGSEYLCAIAAHLGRYPDYRQVLKDIGAPTVFVCDVPLSLIDLSTLREFAGMAIEMVFEELVHGAHGYKYMHQGAALCICSSLPPGCIVGHYSPEQIADPLLA